jgi:phage-related protein
MAGNIKGITIEIGGNTTPLQNALKSVNASTNKLKSELRDVERLLKLDPTNTTLLEQKQKLLAQSVQTAREKLDQLREAEEQVEQQFKEGKIGEEQYRAFQREVVKAEQSLRTAEEQLESFGKTEDETSNDTKELSEAVKKAGKETEDSGDKAEKAKERWSKFGDALKTLAATAAAAAAAVAGVALKLGKEVVSSYADYEQLVGGVETLFRDSAGIVQDYAENAYKTAGLSANEYMETVTGFSASLISSLGGDTEKAARYADMAITDMSDNANKMGSDMASIQNAYQGFAKQNYTMLDNLKLGYGGTKEEMERLLADAEAISGIHYDISNYADVVDAIHVIQTEMGITGTTALEAEKTISGSIGMLKSSFANLITGLGNADADIGKLVGNVVSSFSSVVENVAPIIRNLTQSLPQAVTGMIQAIQPMIPDLLQLGADLFQSLVDGIMSALPGILETAASIITELISGLTSLLPDLVGFGIDLFGALIEDLPGIIEKILEALPQIITAITDKLSTLIPIIVDAGVQLFIALVKNLPAIIAAIVKSIPTIITSIVDAVKQAWPTIAEAGRGLFTKLVDRGAEIIGEIKSFVQNLVQGIVSTITGAFSDFFNVGYNIVMGVWNGLSSGWSWLTGQVSSLAQRLLQSAKNALGIASPSRKFRDEVGKMMAAGIGEGFDVETPKEFQRIKNRLNAEERKLAAAVTNNSTVNNSTSLGGIVININGSVENVAAAKQYGRELASELASELRYKGVLQFA